MSKSQKMLVGFLSALPVILLFVYFASFFGFFITVLRNIHNEDALPELVLERIGMIIGMAVLMGLVSLGIKIYFIILAVNNMAIDGTERLVWILIFVFAGLIGYPVYWYMRIWNERVQEGNLQ